MGHRVGVAVPEQALLEDDPLAAEDQRPPLDEAVAVVADPDPDQAATSAAGSSQE
jgi:hypothetical protein